MEPLYIAVCEDMPQEADRLLAMLQSSSVPTSCTVFSSGEALLGQYRPGLFDLLLMDVYMSGATGIQTVERIRAVDEEVPVAFITTSLDFTRESYRLFALSYLEKPVGQRELERVLEIARLKKENRPALVLSRNGARERIPLTEIVYLEQRARRLLVHLRGGREIPFYEKLSAMPEQLSGQPFFFCHKSFCASLPHVQRIDAGLRCFGMDDGSNVPIRRESMAGAKKAFEDYLFSRTRGGL